jgi:16S rRNA (cytidine1402-2'-O)-methyltransferase
VVGRSGTLYVVATPLGNLGDLSPRAAELLRTVPVVAAEDTRVSRGLLAHLDAHPRLVAFHQHSDASRADALIKILREGEDIALVTDAGTPGVSDPGPYLVEGVRAAGFAVVPIPGPSAVTAAISVSGFPADRYLFLGFAPRKGPERDRWLRQAATPGVTVVCFEAPNRVEELLRELALGGAAGRQGCVGREITKLHEEFRVGTLSELATWAAENPPRGEVTIVFAPADGSGVAGPDPEGARALAADLLAAGRSKRDVVREVADRTGLPRNTVYDLVMELSAEG